MRINARAGVEHAAFDGAQAGEGLAIFLSQEAGSVARYRFLIKGMTGDGLYQVGILFSSPPNATAPLPGPLTRMIGGAVCPGVTSWAVDVSCVNTDVPAETADIVLASSKCCSSRLGASRVNERYAYASGGGAGVTTLNILPGQTLKSWGAVASFGVDGGVTLGTGATVTVPNGFTSSGTPDDAVLRTVTLAFSAVDWFVELAESA